MTQRILRIAQADEELALRLVSALVLGWDNVPRATQGQLLHDASFMGGGLFGFKALPNRLLAFIEANKDPA
jgi:hypothetical protein